VVLAGRSYPILLGLAALAYGFGLRHAVDPDHIAAIDNTTRKLMQDGQKPVGVGLYFSLGHSTVVVALSVAVAFSAGLVQRQLPTMQAAGAVIGTSVSCVFLMVIGLINLIVLIDVVRAWRRVTSGGEYDESEVNGYLDQRGLLARLFRPLLRMVRRSSDMYLVGLLFGLGFDTASEVGLLGISASTGAAGMPIWNILLLPAVFTAGMALVDTLDGILMLGAYGWAYIRPVRKLYYNLNITLASVLVALLVGGLEALQVIGRELQAGGGFWAAAASIRLDDLGFIIIGGFAACWITSVVIYKVRGYERLDAPRNEVVPQEAV
jgi:nickel/cobalt transporter (NiCoT) family protein